METVSKMRHRERAPLKRISAGSIAIGITLAALVLSCGGSSQNPTEDLRGYFTVRVVGRGMNCGDVYLVEFVEDLFEMYEIVGSDEFKTFYADSLPAQFKQKGQMLLVKFRKPSPAEQYECRSLGPSYPHIVITAAQKPAGPASDDPANPRRSSSGKTTDDS